MNIVVSLIAIVALLAILGVLGAGIFQLFRGGDPRRANRLMRYRIILQFGLLMLLGLFALIFQR
jgi:hypothetical protein